jgi:SulP family sulfate permease
LEAKGGPVALRCDRIEGLIDALPDDVMHTPLADGRAVPAGTVVDSQAKADALPAATDAQHHFNEDVVDVNRGLAAAYRRLVDAGHTPRHLAAGLEPAPWDERWARTTDTDRF